MTGNPLKILIDRSCFVLNIKEKIQDSVGIPIDQQRLVARSLSGDVQHMIDWRKISDYGIEGDTISLVLRLGGPPSASLLDPKLFDTSKNYDFTWLQDNGQIYKRGNYVYQMPYGWNRIALNVEKYDDNKWLGEDPV